MEINKNELRIGNIVSWNGEIAVISQLLERDISFKCGEECLYEDIKPIPLTEEVLLRCGFEITDYRIELHPIQLIELVENKGYLFEFHLTRESKQGSEYFTVIKCLHQLQNLYYSLCNEELTYNHSQDI